MNNINTVKFFTQAHLDFIVEFLLPRSYPGFFRGVESRMERGKQCQTGRSLAYDRSSLKPLQQSQPHTIEHVWSWWMITYTISSKHFNLPSLTTPLLSFNLFWCFDLCRKKQQNIIMFWDYMQNFNFCPKRWWYFISWPGCWAEAVVWCELSVEPRCALSRICLCDLHDYLIVCCVPVL